MIQTKINTYPVIFTKTFSGLEPEILEEVKTVYPGRVLFVDTAPMPGLVKAIEQVRSACPGTQVILRDHHDVDGEPKIDRDREIRLAAETVREMLGSNAVISNRRANPACSSLIEVGEFDGAGTLVIADPDPDGLTAAMKALGVTYPELDTDAAILDGPRAAQTRENGLSEVAMLLVKSMATLPLFNAGNPAPSEKAKAALFGEFVKAATGDEAALASLSTKVEAYEAGVREGERLAGLAVEVTVGVYMVDAVGQPRHDLGTLAARLDALPGCAVTIVRKGDGPIAGKHGGIQYSLAVPKPRQAEVNLQEFVPAKFMEVAPDDRLGAGFISNTSFLLHVSEAVWEAEVFPALRARFGDHAREYAVYGYDSSPIWGTEEEAYALLVHLGHPAGCSVESRRK